MFCFVLFCFFEKRRIHAFKLSTVGFGKKKSNWPTQFLRNATWGQHKFLIFAELNNKYHWGYCKLEYCWGTLRGYCTPGPYFWRLCIKKNKNKNKKIGQRIQWIWLKCSKQLNSTGLFQLRPWSWSYSKNVWKSISSMFWFINQ